MDLEQVLNLSIDSGPVIKYLKSDCSSLREFILEQMTHVVTSLNNKELNTEIQYLQSLHRKYRNAQRHFIHYQTISMLRRKMMRLMSSTAVNVIKTAAKKHWKLSASESHLSPSRQMFDYVLVAWMQLSFDVFVMQKLSVRSYVRCRRQTSLGHFAKLSFVFMSIVARISGHLRKLDEHLVSSYKSLLHARTLLPAAKTEWLLEGLTLPPHLDFESLSQEKLKMVINPLVDNPFKDTIKCTDSPMFSEVTLRDEVPFANLLWADTEFVNTNGYKPKDGEEHRKRKKKALSLKRKSKVSKSDDKDITEFVSQDRDNNDTCLILKKKKKKRKGKCFDGPDEKRRKV